MAEQDHDISLVDNSVSRVYFFSQTPYKNIQQNKEISDIYVTIKYNLTIIRKKLRHKTVLK